MWAQYWTGSMWAQGQMDSGALISTSSSGAVLDTTHVLLFLNSNGLCSAESFNGSMWVHALLGDGGISTNQLGSLNLTGGLSYQRSSNLVFARRSDGNVVVFYYQ